MVNQIPTAPIYPPGTAASPAEGGAKLNMQELISKAAVYVADQFANTPPILKSKFSLEKDCFRYLKLILDDQEFQSDPAKYLKEWQQRKAGLEAMQMPDNIAYDFVRQMIAAERSAPETIGNATLASRANEYVKNLFPPSAYAQGRFHDIPTLFEDAIKEVLSDPAFQEDPKKYLQNRKEHPTYTDHFETIEHVVMDFFEHDTGFINKENLCQK